MSETKSTISFSHPHIETNVYDNSEVTAVATKTDKPMLFQPYFSEKGISGKLEQFYSPTDFIKLKGTPNFKKYGQAQYNILNWLQGGGRVLGVRLAPEDATYANVGLNVKTKVVTAEDLSVSVSIKLETVKFPSLIDNSDTSIKALVKTFTDTAPVEDGYKNNILFVVSSAGKGVYGENYSIRITENDSFSKNYDFKCYDFALIETKSNQTIVTTEGPIGFSLYPEAISLSGNGLTLSQIIETYLPNIECYFDETTYDSIIDEIQVALKVGEVFYYDNPAQIDLLFGDTKIIVDRTNATSLFAYEGIHLEDGSNGAIGAKYNDASFVVSRDKLFTDVYSGISIPELYDKKRYPIDVLLDFNSSDSVKKSISQMASTRGDCICLIDTSSESVATTISWKQGALIIDTEATSYLTSIWSQMFTIYDNYSASTIPVTSTYYLANKIPANDNNYGIQYPFVGPNRGIISGYKSINWTPTEEQKEQLYDNRINYVEENYRNTRFMNQLTAQNKNTSLSDINHVRVMLKVIRSIEELTENYLFEFANDDTISRINASLDGLLSIWVTNGTCKLCKGVCSQTALELENKTAHVSVAIVFTNVMEKILVDINISR